ncbi:MAG: TonB-dependent receptor family protein, partial [bacterium]
RDPAPDRFRGEVEQVMGSHGLSRSQLTGSGSLDGTDYLASVSRVGWDGFRTIPDGNGARYGESERFTFNSRVRHNLAGGRLSLTVNGVELEAENPGSVPEELQDDPDRPVAPFPYLAHRTRKELTQAQAGVEWEGPLGEALRGNVSLYGIRRDVVNPIPFNYIDLSRRAGGTSARLSGSYRTGEVELSWHAGAELDLQDDERREYPNQEGEPGPEPHTDQAERVRAVGVFIQTGLALPGGGRALAGLRYDQHEFRARDHIVRDPDQPSSTGRRSMDQVSPSLGVSIPVTSAVTVFGSLGAVFETPSTTELKNRPDGAGGFNPELEPQRGRTGEVGVRLRPRPSLAAELTAFRTDLRGELIPFEVPEVEGQVFFRNAGSSRHTGLEATVSAVSSSGLVRGDLTYTLTDARFRDYEVDGEALDGNRIPGLAPSRARGSLRLQPESWFVVLGASYVDRLPLNDGNTAHAPSHLLWDLRAGLESVRLGRVRLEPWTAVENLTDRRYVASAAVNAAGGRYFEPGPGRTWQLGLRAGF